MDAYSSSARLLKSESWKAQLMGLTIALFMFAPNVFRIAGDERLTIWARLEQLSISIGQTLLVPLTLALDPESLANYLEHGKGTGTIKQVRDEQTGEEQHQEGDDQN